MNLPAKNSEWSNTQMRKTLTKGEFAKLSEFITTNYGIKLPEHKKVMVEGRLHKRLKALSIETFAEYIELVLGDEETEEVINMINAVSTNKTDFFREPAHFDYMTQEILPDLFGKLAQNDIKIWSAAASTGEEIYTIAMVIEEFLLNAAVNRKPYAILGTDISVDALKAAINGVYHMSRIADVPLQLKRRYFLKNKDPKVPTARVKPELRNRTKFGRLNLMDQDYALEDRYDIIFCRNVLIYFDRENQNRVISRLVSKLKPGGYLFVGHSESLFNKGTDLQLIKPTIYKKKI